MAILGELQLVAGRMLLSSSLGQPGAQCRVAYLSQHPWVISGTVRENILFGEPYKAGWMARVVKACALEEDLALLANGEMTCIGERGVTLR